MARVKKGRPLSGVLILDKPQGMSSNRALQKVRHLFQAQKGGHTGSLDPLATGVLPVCLGEATKFSSFLLDADKTYVATAQLGVITATGDSEGEVLERRAVPTLTEAQLDMVLDAFRGPISQIPTMYSALKFEGRPLYQYAREGITIERKARNVTIKQLRLDGLTNDSFRITVQCTKGTYIRTLVEDIGLTLGCGAHVTQLRRTQAGHFDLPPAWTLERLMALGEQAENFSALDAQLLPIDILLPQFPGIAIESATFESIFRGQAVRIPHPENSTPALGSLLKLYIAEQDVPETADLSMFSPDQGRYFLGLAEVVALVGGTDWVLQPRRLIRSEDQTAQGVEEITQEQSIQSAD